MSTTTLVGQIITPDGSNLKKVWSADPRHFWAPVQPRVWMIPGVEVRSIQAPEIPLRLNHGAPPVGEITHLERRDDGSIWCVGEIDVDISPERDRDYFLSVEATWTEGTIGRDVEITGAALCEKSAMIGLHPVTLLNNGLDQRGQAAWRLGSFQQSLLEHANASRRARRYGDPIVVEGASTITEASSAARSAGTVLEMRSAGVVDVCRPMREVDLLCAPAEVPSTIYERGKRYEEVFSHGAFSGAERNPGAVKLNHAHKIEAVVGRAIAIDPWSELGCVATFRISKIAAGDEAITMLEDGLVTPSVGMMVAPSGEEWRDGGSTRRIRRAKLHHVGLTADAAHKTAVLGMRGSALASALR